MNPNAPSPEALTGPEIAEKTARLGLAKAGMAPLTTFILAVLAGAFIALGCIFSTTVLAGSETLPYGVARLLAGLSFSLGLILVVCAGAELFTGNILLVVAWGERKISFARLAVNWAIVFAGNAAGALATAGLVLASHQYESGKGSVGLAALNLAEHKDTLGFGQAVALGILCNALVCLAVWLAYSAKSLTDRLIAVVPPVTAFVAIGAEHSIANIYFIPFAILLKTRHAFLATLSPAPDVHALTWGHFLAANLLPVTIGNIIGGGVLVGGVYWLAYLRPLRASA
jgi:formate transporter